MDKLQLLKDYFNLLQIEEQSKELLEITKTDLIFDLIEHDISCRSLFAQNANSNSYIVPVESNFDLVKKIGDVIKMKPRLIGDIITSQNEGNFVVCK